MSRAGVVFGILVGIVFGWVVPAACVEVVALSPARDASPGDVVTHVFSIAQDAASPDVFAISVDVPVGWAFLGAPPSVALAPGAEEIVFVTVVIPAEALASTYPIALHAVSQSDPTNAASADVETRVAAVNELDVLPPSGESVSPGHVVRYTFGVANRGNSQDVVRLTVISSRGLQLVLSAETVPLAPRESTSVLVEVSLPNSEAPGRDVLTLRASSTIYPGVEDEAAVFTTILPPLPDAVGGSLLAVLQTRLTLGIERDEIAGTFGSRLSLATSGSLLGGDLSASFAVDAPFGPSPLAVTAYAILYRIASVTWSVGGISEEVSDLLAVSCDGASVRLDLPFAQALLATGGSSGETRFGGGLALGPESARVGFGYVDARSGTDRRAAFTATALSSPLPGWTMRMEGGWGLEGGRTGRALFFGSDLETESLFASCTAISVGTHFPSPLQDLAGMKLSQRLRFPGLSIGLSFSRTRSNVLGDPAARTLVSGTFGGNLDVTPFEDGPTLQTTIEFASRRSEEAPIQDQIDLLFEARLGASEGTFGYEFSGGTRDALDRAAGTHLRTLSFGERLTLSVEGFAVELSLEQQRVTDRVAEIVLSREARAALSLRPSGTAHVATLGFSGSGDDFALDVSVGIYPSDAVEISLDGSIGWSRGPAPDVRFGWGMELGLLFDLPVPFLVERGRIEGSVYIDLNADGQRDEGDLPVAGAVIYADGLEVATDAGGTFRSPPLAPGEYALRVGMLPQGLLAAGAVEVAVTAGRTTAVDLPLAPAFAVRGTVFSDENRDGSRQPGEPGIEGAVVQLRSDTTTQSARSDGDGRYALFDVASGEYVASLDLESLSDRFEPTTPVSLSIAASTELPEVDFGGFVRPREVVITFQPPTAEGSFTPQRPVVGEPVTFDASTSFDFDGELVSFTWDVDDDGTVDADRPVTVFTFSAAGTRTVRLTVTDDAGNDDSIVLTVEVGNAAPASLPPASTVVRPPIADFSYAPLAPIAGQPVTFDASPSVDFDGGIVLYAWDLDGDGRVDAEGREISYAFAAAGRYTIALTVTDDVGSGDTMTAVVDVEAATPTTSGLAPIAHFTFAPAAPAAGTVVRFDASPSIDPDGVILSYAWDFDGDGIADASGLTVERSFAATDAVVTVHLTVIDDQGATASATQSFLVSEPSLAPESAASQPPIADLQYMPSNPRPGEPVMFNASASVDLDGSIVAWTWDFNGDGTPDAAGAITVYAFPSRGAFPVSVTVVDDAGNRDTATVTLNVD
ncbi:MAG: PKD domain-containing protein [Candidatus Bipolaricaulota bacterium]